MNHRVVYLLATGLVARYSVVLTPHQAHYEEEVSSLRLVVARRCCAVTVGSLLGKHLPPDDELTDPLLGRQRQQAVVLAVQAHIQQVLFRQMVGDQVGLKNECVERKIIFF